MIDLTEHDQLIDQLVYMPNKLIKDISNRFSTESLGKMLTSAGLFKCDTTYFNPRSDGFFECGYTAYNMEYTESYDRYRAWTCAVVAVMHTKNLHSFPELAEMDIDD